MNSTTTSVWCVLRIEHDFFANPQFAKLLQLTPTRETQRHGAAIRAVGDQAIVYGPPNTSRPAALGFEIAFRERQFVAYTDFAGQPPEAGRIIYLNPGSETIIDVARAPRLPLRPNRFFNPLTRFVATAEVGPLGEAGQPLAIGSEDFRRNSLPINLAAGGHTLKLTASYRTTCIESFYVSDQFTPAVAAFEWRPKDSDEPPPIFTLKFAARKTYWRYHIIGLPEDLWSDTSIAPATTNGNGQPGIPFTAIADPFILPDGRKARVYLSDQPIARRQHQKLKVKLRSPSVFDGHLLPHAGNHLGVIQDEGDQPIICSDIFVQL